MLLLTVGCSQHASQVGEIGDTPIAQEAAYKKITETLPAHGIAVRQGKSIVFEVNVESADSSRVAVGKEAEVRTGGSKERIRCRIFRVVRNPSTETDGAIAWLRPLTPSRLTAGEFVSADIFLETRAHVLSVPRQALFIRDGETLAILQTQGEKGSVGYQPVTVRIGISSKEDAEILGGLKAGDKVVIKGGMGYLYPDFKASTEE